MQLNQHTIQNIQSCQQVATFRQELSFNNYFLAARERDARKYCRVPGRLLGKFTFDAEQAKAWEDCEIDDDDVESV